MNSIQLVGRLVRDPEARAGGSTSIANFTVAVDDWNSKTKQKEGVFFRCVAFGKTADVVIQYATKGTQVAIVGRCKPNQWQDKDGNKRETWEVIVNDFQMIGPKPQSQNRQPTTDDDFEDEPPSGGSMFG